jgi:hypothetical protein
MTLVNFDASDADNDGRAASEATQTLLACLARVANQYHPLWQLEAQRRRFTWQCDNTYPLED